jgi:hypothetical protein
MLTWQETKHGWCVVKGARGAVGAVIYSIKHIPGFKDDDPMSRHICRREESGVADAEYDFAGGRIRLLYD